MLTTSSVLPAAEYPLFASEEAVSLDGPNRLRPGYRLALRGRGVRRRGLAAAAQDDRPDQPTPGQAADISFEISYDTEALYDYVIVEAHTVGQDDWTTLPDENGHTSTTPASRA